MCTKVSHRRKNLMFELYVCDTLNNEMTVDCELSLEDSTLGKLFIIVEEYSNGHIFLFCWLWIEHFV